MSKGRERLLAIAASIVDETVDDDQLRELNALLEDNDDNQLLYKRFLELHCQLDWILGSPADLIDKEHNNWSGPKDGRRPRYRTWMVGASACAAAVLLLVLFLKPWQRGPGIEGALSDFQGDVVVTGPGGKTRPIARGMSLEAGDFIETRNADAFAALTYSDQSRFVVVSNSAAQLDGRNIKNVVLRRGRLIASVESQSSSEPFLVTTPHAEVQVRGTKFAIESLKQQTNLNVLEGRLGVTSGVTKDSVEISEGEYLVAHIDGPITVEALAAENGGWSESFENGIPENWRGGVHETEGLPGDSKGGVRAAEIQIGDDVRYQIHSQEEWARGLFTYRDDLHLHITFKMDHSNWANIFFIARTRDAKNHKTFLHKYTIPFGPGGDGVWWRMIVPLSKFQLQIADGFEDIPPTDDEVVFGILFSSPAPDRGWVIDEVAVQRGGPGKYVVEQLD